MALSEKEIQWFNEFNEKFKKSTPILSEEDKTTLKRIDLTVEIINQLISLNKQTIEKVDAQLKDKKGWKKKSLEDAITKLENIKKLNSEYKEKIQNQNPLNQSPISRFSNYFFYGLSTFYINQNIFFLSPIFILQDVSWLYGITHQDVKDISLSKKDKTSLEKYLSPLIKKITKEVIPYLKEHNEFKQRVILIKEAMKCADKGFINASNILLMSIIEGIIRILAQFVMDNQNIIIKQYEFKSIENLIILKHRDNKKKFKWGDEIFDGQESLYNLQKNLSHEFENLLKHDDIHNIKTHTNFSERFDFLIKSYKDERNIIIHGNRDEFGEKWRYYIQLSALYKTYLEIKFYYNLYEK